MPARTVGRELTLAIIRHAVARPRQTWTGDDLLRPLTPRGQHQAERLPELLATVPVRRVVSSPALRCVQTVTPLSARLGLPVEYEPAFGEGDVEQALSALVGLVGQHVAVCTHGDVVPEVLGWAAEQGAQLPSAPRWKKGSLWLLHAKGARIVGAEYLAPPA